MLQEHYMGNDRFMHSWKFDVLNTMICAGLSHDLAHSGIMHVRDLGKQMMFNLKIQPAHKPAHKLITCCKIRGGIYLVNRPLVINLIGIDTCHGESGMLNRVRQLKYNADQ